MKKLSKIVALLLAGALTMPSPPAAAVAVMAWLPKRLRKIK